MSSKKFAVIAILGLLILGGAGFGFYLKKMNTQEFRGIAFSVRGVEKEAANDWVETFQAVLQKDEILQAIITESDYVAKLEVAEGDALNQLRDAIFIGYNEARGTIQIGLRGKRKQRAKLDGISQNVFSISAPFVAQVKPAFKAHFESLSKAGQ